METPIPHHSKSRILHTAPGPLREADLKDLDLRGADLPDADLSYAALTGAKLQEANLREATARAAEFDFADLAWADLEGADLEGANLSWANLAFADLRGADLRGANLMGAYLEATDFRGANLYRADLRWTHAPCARLPEGFVLLHLDWEPVEIHLQGPEPWVRFGDWTGTLEWWDSDGRRQVFEDPFPVEEEERRSYRAALDRALGIARQLGAGQ